VKIMPTKRNKSKKGKVYGDPMVELG